VSGIGGGPDPTRIRPKGPSGPAGGPPTRNRGARRAPRAPRARRSSNSGRTGTARADRRERPGRGARAGATHERPGTAGDASRHGTPSRIGHVMEQLFVREFRRRRPECEQPQTGGKVNVAGNRARTPPGAVPDDSVAGLAADRVRDLHAAAQFSRHKSRRHRPLPAAGCRRTERVECAP